jgi:hypothetical protein
MIVARFEDEVHIVKDNGGKLTLRKGEWIGTRNDTEGRGGGWRVTRVMDDSIMFQPWGSMATGGTTFEKLAEEDWENLPPFPDEEAVHEAGFSLWGEVGVCPLSGKLLWTVERHSPTGPHKAIRVAGDNYVIRS